MKIDVVRYGYQSISSLSKVNGFTYFKKNYCNLFKERGQIYIRYVGKNYTGIWRFLPNRSTDFCRCPQVTSYHLTKKLDHDFEVYL